MYAGLGFKLMAIGALSVFLSASLPQQSYGWGGILAKSVKVTSKGKVSKIPASQSAKTVCVATEKCGDKSDKNKEAAEKLRKVIQDLRDAKKSGPKGAQTQ